MTQECFAHRIILCAIRSVCIKSSLILLAVGFWCAPLSGATNEDANFETPPPKPGSFEWETIQRLAKERQELYRKRVSIPGVVTGEVPKAAGANLAYRQQITPPPQAPSLAGASEKLTQILLYTTVLIFTGVLVARRFAPHAWSIAPASERVFPAKVRAEEEAFTEFVAAFRVGPPTPPRTDASVKSDAIKDFYARAAKLLATQRTLFQDISRGASGQARQKMLANLGAEMNALKSAADFPEVLPVWQMASALEGLLKQLTDKMGNVTPSTLRAVGGGVDLLDELCASRLKPGFLTEQPLKFLVVDDDLISRQALSLALKKTFSQPDLAVDGAAAMIQASQQAYDVIFLDVQMPNMDGFELCTKIRETVLNRATPVIFVTSQSDFDARAKSILTGGNDLMGKPFLTFEVTVKALTLALRGRLHGHVEKPFQKLVPAKGAAASSEPAGNVVPSVASPVLITPPAPEPEPVRFTNAFLARASKRFGSLTTRSPLASSATVDKAITAFLARAATHLGPLRDLCRKILQVTDEEARQSLLADGFLRINLLVSKTDSAVAHPAYQVSAALEGLFRKLLENPKNSTASTLATVTAAVDLLNDLCVPGVKTDLATNPPVHLLVVDDDLVARRAITGALQTAFEKPENVESGEAALVLAMEKTFDVIFMDVVMPGMDGFEVCSKIRKTIPNRATPVVFVTGQNDSSVHAQMRRNGGNDLLGKPFFTAEITVKALTFALRGRLEQIKVRPSA